MDYPGNGEVLADTDFQQICAQNLSEISRFKRSLTSVCEAWEPKNVSVVFKSLRLFKKYKAATVRFRYIIKNCTLL